MLLFKTTAEMQKYIKIDSTTKEINFLPSVGDAQEKYIRPVLGKVMLKELLVFYNYATLPAGVTSVEGAAVKYKELLDVVCNALAKFTFFLASPSYDLRLTDSGFAVMMNTNMAPASKDRVKALRDALELQGWDCVETLIRYLEENKDFFTAWKDSEAYTMQLRNFINSAEEFDSFVPIDNSRLKFKGMRGAMTNVELLRIAPVISTGLSVKIKGELKANVMCEADKKIIDLLKRSVANYTAAEEIDPRYEKFGDSFLAEVRRVLDATPGDYPEYQGSTSFKTSASYQGYENIEESGLFMFGN